MAASFCSKVEPKDIIAVIAIIGGFILLAKGIDTTVGGILIAITAYYFRKRTEDFSPKKAPAKSNK